MTTFSSSPWSSPESSLSPEDFAKVCLIDANPPGKPKVKELCKLPVRSTPGGPVNKNAVHAATGAHGIQGVKGVSSDEKRSAAKKLVSLYNSMGETAPESTYRVAGMKRPAGKLPMK